TADGNVTVPEVTYHLETGRTLVNFVVKARTPSSGVHKVKLPDGVQNPRDVELVFDLGTSVNTVLARLRVMAEAVAGKILSDGLQKGQRRGLVVSIAELLEQQEQEAARNGRKSAKVK